MIALDGFSWAVELPDGKMIRGTSKSKSTADEAARLRINQWRKANKPAKRPGDRT